VERRARRLTTTRSGAAAIEFVFVASLLVTAVTGATGLGFYFTQRASLGHGATAAAATAATLPAGTTPSPAQKSGVRRAFQEAGSLTALAAKHYHVRVRLVRLDKANDTVQEIWSFNDGALDADLRADPVPDGRFTGCGACRDGANFIVIGAAMTATGTLSLPKGLANFQTHRVVHLRDQP